MVMESGDDTRSSQIIREGIHHQRAWLQRGEQQAQVQRRNFVGEGIDANCHGDKVLLVDLPSD